MSEKRKALVISSLLGDSLAMPVHWIYDTSEIDQRFGRVENLLYPPKSSYHGTRVAGELTHYGDQVMVLLKSVADNAGFDLSKFAEEWRKLFQDYKGYRDRATKTTLSNFEEGKGPSNSGSPSTDLAGAGRIAPLVYCYADDLEALILSCRAQTAMTHNNPMVIEASELSAILVSKILAGSTPVSALKQLRDEAPNGSTPFGQWIEEGLKSTDEDTRKAIGKFGQSCAIKDAFRAVVHLVAKYQNNLREALVENVMAGGDSAARGLLVGMFLAAYNGMNALPAEWLSGLRSYRQIIDLLTQVDAAKGVA
ncbi:MAG: ADP-ribosylglycohydrolase family protein [Desulforhabdus sp.]|jgi:ADP-ribosylglycohydrolase|nr:ADP-ribosylglycohydrolase family protein [Desulforhabdus sp.]